MKLKTREAFHNIKTFDRAEDLAKKTRQGVSDLNQSVDQVQESGYESGTDYAGNQVQNAEGQFSWHGFYTADRIGKWGMRTTKNNLKRLQSGGKATESANSAKTKIISNTNSRHSANKNRLRRTSGANPVSVSKQSVKSRATAKASQRAAQFAKQAAKTTVKAVKKTVKATIAAVKAVIAGTKALIAALAAGGWIAVVVIIIVCIIGFIVGVVSGEFF